MDKLHMGHILEKDLRRKGLNLSELAIALNITRRTLYNWFSQEVINEPTMERISSVINAEFMPRKFNPLMLKNTIAFSKHLKDEAYWQDRYVELLELYSNLLMEGLTSGTIKRNNS